MYDFHLGEELETKNVKNICTASRMCLFWFWEIELCVFGLKRSEKNTNIGGALSGALVSTLIGLAASNLGVISSNAPAFSIVLEFLLPLAVPLLLYRADLRRVIKSTGALLLAFLLGSGRILSF